MPSRPATIAQHLAFFVRLPPGEMFGLFRQAAAEWVEDDAARLAAALAYYAIFSATPLLVVVIAVAGAVFGPAAARGEVVSGVSHLIGEQAAQMLQGALRSTSMTSGGLAASIVSVITVALGASLVIAHFRASLRVIWNLPPEESKESLLGSIFHHLRQRAVAFLVVVGVGFVLLLLLLLQTVIGAAGSYFDTFLPMPEAGLQAIQMGIWLVVMTVLFTLMYRVLTDANPSWGVIVVGAGFTAILFTAGSTLLALYLGKVIPSSTYGAAGSLVLFLAWIYYSSLVVFFGAEFMQVYARQYGDGLDGKGETTGEP